LCESYWADYPRRGIEEDLNHEPCHIKCNDIVSVFSNLSGFESWSKAVAGHEIEDLEIEELRIVKVDAVRVVSCRFQVPCSSLTLVGMHLTRAPSSEPISVPSPSGHSISPRPLGDKYEKYEGVT